MTSTELAEIITQRHLREKAKESRYRQNSVALETKCDKVELSRIAGGEHRQGP